VWYTRRSKLEELIKVLLDNEGEIELSLSKYVFEDKQIYSCLVFVNEETKAGGTGDTIEDAVRLAKEDLEHATSRARAKD
jgi:hypothetical protein